MRLTTLEDHEADETRWATPPPRPTPPLRLVPHDPAPGDDGIARMLTLVLEAMDGRRPVDQLSASMAGPVYESLLTRARGATGVMHRLIGVRSSRASPSVIELCATVRVIPLRRPEAWRAVAAAARLERAETWRFTYLRFLNTPMPVAALAQDRRFPLAAVG